MEFSDEVDSNQSDEDRHDDDLLKMQKQKSIPMVAVTEFVDDDDEEVSLNVSGKICMPRSS